MVFPGIQAEGYMVKSGAGDVYGDRDGGRDIAGARDGDGEE